MGTVFSLYKRKPKQRYEIGKPRHGYAPGMAPPEKTLLEKLSLLQKTLAALIGPPSTKQLSDHYAEMTALTNPAWSHMWSLMGTPDYSVFKLSRFTREELAHIMLCASQNIDTIEDALKVADHMLAWAGDDDITLNPEEPGDLKDLGWPTRGYRDAGSIWDAM
jgi:hypothetical protein